MRLSRLRIENFRKFRAPVVLEGFAAGLNLVCEPNEAGKSTVLDALRAALFERHSAKSDRIRSFRPQGDEVAPTVELTFDLGGGPWRLEKRFLLAPSVTLEGPDGRFSSEAAEEKLQALLGFARPGNRGADDDSRGALGLLWVEQGQSFQLGAPGETARRTLEEALAGEIGAVTGGRRAKAVTAQVNEALADVLTATGRPTGRLRQAMEDADAARLAAAERARELAQFEEVLERLEAKRAERQRLDRDIRDPQTDADLKALEGDIARAQAAGQALEIAAGALREAASRRDGLDRRRRVRADLVARLSAAELMVKAAAEAVAAHGEAMGRARAGEGEAGAVLASARAALREAEALRDKAAGDRAEAERRRVLAAAFGRLERAEELASAIREREARIAAERMDEKALAHLRRLEEAEGAARAQAEAGAATLTLALEPGAPAVTLDGAPLVDGASIRLVGEARIVIPGVGAIGFAPPASGEHALARLRAASRDLADFLAASGHATPAAARAAGRLRARDEAELLGLSTRLKAECPADSALGIAAGLDALRGALAGLPRPAPEEKEAPAVATDLEGRYRVARAAEVDAVARREAALETLRAAELKEVSLAAALERADGERARLAEELSAETRALADEALSAALAEAGAAEARAQVDRDGAQRVAEALDAAQFIRRRDALRRRQANLQAQLPELAGEVARLEEQARTLGGEGPASRAAAAGEEAEAAAAALARVKAEADTLALLHRVLKEAQQDAARRYLAPVTRRIEPYVRRLLPTASLSFGEDLRPRLLARAGREEAAELLSKGTQEQIAILTRIAFAELLMDKGQPASLVLDDALVFADDERFDAMMEILAEVSRRMQVLVLSCRTSAYRGIEAKRIALGPL